MLEKKKGRKKIIVNSSFPFFSYIKMEHLCLIYFLIISIKASFDYISFKIFFPAFKFLSVWFIFWTKEKINRWDSFLFSFFFFSFKIIQAVKSNWDFSPKNLLYRSVSANTAAHQRQNYRQTIKKQCPKQIMISSVTAENQPPKHLQPDASSSTTFSLLLNRF